MTLPKPSPLLSGPDHPATLQWSNTENIIAITGKMYIRIIELFPQNITESNIACSKNYILGGISTGTQKARPGLSQTLGADSTFNDAKWSPVSRNEQNRSSILVLETSHRVAIYAKINNVWRTQIEVHEIIADHYNIKIDKYGWKADPAKTHLLEFSAIAWSPICHDFQNPMNNISVIALGSRGGQLTLLTAPDLRIQSITQVTQDWVTKIAFSDWVCSKNCNRIWIAIAAGNGDISIWSLQMSRSNDSDSWQSSLSQHPTIYSPDRGRIVAVCFHSINTSSGQKVILTVSKLSRINIITLRGIEAPPASETDLDDPANRFDNQELALSDLDQFPVSITWIESYECFLALFHGGSAWRIFFADTWSALELPSIIKLIETDDELDGDQSDGDNNEDEEPKDNVTPCHIWGAAFSYNQLYCCVSHSSGSGREAQGTATASFISLHDILEATSPTPADAGSLIERAVIKSNSLISWFNGGMNDFHHGTDPLVSTATWDIGHMLVQLKLAQMDQYANLIEATCSRLLERYEHVIQYEGNMPLFCWQANSSIRTALNQMAYVLNVFCEQSEKISDAKLRNLAGFHSIIQPWIMLLPHLPKDKAHQTNYDLRSLRLHIGNTNPEYIKEVIKWLESEDLRDIIIRTQQTSSREWMNDLEIRSEVLDQIDDPQLGNVERCPSCGKAVQMNSLLDGTCVNGHRYVRCTLTFLLLSTLKPHRCPHCTSPRLRIHVKPKDYDELTFIELLSALQQRCLNCGG